MHTGGSDGADLETEIPEEAWTVARLNGEIEAVLDDSADRFPSHVVGEIGELSQYSYASFFELRDLKADPVISCIAWSSTVQALDYELEEGTEAVLEADVDFYPDRGECQLIVRDFWPLGESDRKQELEALKKELDEEGLFDDERKQPIPPHPATIGLVTSPSGSAREDTWASIHDRSPRTDVYLCGASVQGEEAVPSLIGAITELDTRSTIETIILTRGGGSDTDLFCFNAEPLVRCVAACSTPIVVAIGHEDDETLVEYVADARAMTPTEAGVLATTRLETVKRTLETIEHRITSGYESLVSDRLDGVNRQIELAFENLSQRVSQRQSRTQRASDLEHRIDMAYTSLIKRELEALDDRIDAGLQEIELAKEAREASIEATKVRIMDIESRIDTAYDGFVSGELDRLEQRIGVAFQELEAADRVAAGTAQARRLRYVVAVLLGILLLETGLIIYLLL